MRCGVKKLSSKSSGERAELLFAAECYVHKMVVMFPHTDDINYDFVIDNGKKLLKIQVKSSRTQCSGSTAFTINYKKTKQFSNLDFYALYCYESGNFYIVPNKIIKSNSFYASKNMYMYKNAWHLLKV